MRRPLLAAVSTGQRNSMSIRLDRCFEAQIFSRLFVQLPGHFIQLGLGKADRSMPFGNDVARAALDQGGGLAVGTAAQQITFSAGVSAGIAGGRFDSAVKAAACFGGLLEARSL